MSKKSNLKSKLKKGDEVEVVRGKDKGKRGKIEKVLTKAGKVIIPGINVFKRHKKARLQNEKSEIVDITKPLVFSSVGFICPNCHKISRIGYKIEKNDKIRICRNCKKAV